MRVKRVSIVSGIEYVKDIPVTIDQIIAHSSGTPVSVAFGHLSSTDKEFLLSGVIEEEADLPVRTISAEELIA